MMKEYGYEYDTILDKELYEKTKGIVTHEKLMGALCLRSGRDALKVVAREFKSAVALIPALSCASMILPFEMYGHEVKFYKLKKDYSIDLDSLYSLIINERKTILFLYLDYFGNKAIAHEELERLKEIQTNLIFIEDCTHNLFVKSNYSFVPDYTVASLRKWIDIPDGGLLWTSRKVMNPIYSLDTRFYETRLKAQSMRHHFLDCGEGKIKSQYRKIFNTVTDMIDEEVLPGLMSQYSYDRACETDFKEIIAVRERNAQILIDELKDFVFVQTVSGRGDLYVAVLIEKRDAIQKKLAQMGIFCTIIWPLNDKQRNVCAVAKYTEEHILSIYCDQRYNIFDMKYVASCIREVCHE